MNPPPRSLSPRRVLRGGPVVARCSLAVALSLGVGACGSSDPVPLSPDASVADVPAADAPRSDAPAASVAIAFAHTVGGAPLALGTTTPYTNAAGNSFGVTRLSYFVSGVTVRMRDGRSLTAPGARYLDAAMPATLRFALPGAAPVGELASITFVMGLPPELNISGAFTSSPESLMEWPEMMGGGYHHMKFEGRYINRAGEPFNFMAHSGGLNRADYSFAVTLDASGRSITAAGASFTVRMDVAEWFTGPNTWDLNDYFNATHRGIMGDAAAQASLRENGASVFSLAAP